MQLLTFTPIILGFDTHANVEENLSKRFIEVNEGIQAFTEELKKMGLWNNVVTIQTSDFARTLHPNSGDGTGKFFTCMNHVITSTGCSTLLQHCDRPCMGWKLYDVWRSRERRKDIRKIP